MRCIPPSIQHMLAHRTHRHHYHHTHLYNIDPDAGDLIPPQPQDPNTGRPHPPSWRQRRGRSRRGLSVPWRHRDRARRRRRRHGGRRGSWRGGQGRPGPGTGTGTRCRISGGQGPPPRGGSVWVAELGLLRDHQGDEEPALRCRAPPEGRGELGCAPRGVGRSRRTTRGSSGK